MSVECSAMKFEEIRNDYDYELTSYMEEVEKAYSRSFVPYAPQPEDEEEILYRRRVCRSFARRLLEYLQDSGGLSSETQEAIECLEDGLRAGKGQRLKVYFPERIYHWLKTQRAYIEAYLDGRYGIEMGYFFGESE